MQTIRVNTRIIAASNRDLAAEVAAHLFREDLFYRLNVITLRVPPLRERREDILPLAERMLQAEAIRNHRPGLSFSPDAATTLMRYRWPGNVRELRNAIERAVVLASGEPSCQITCRIICFAKRLIQRPRPLPGTSKKWSVS